MAWETPKHEMGICIRCGKCKNDCVHSDKGWICHDCWQALVRDESQRGMKANVPPPSSMTGFVVLDSQGNYITVGGTLYFFKKKEFAQDLLERIHQSDPRIKASVAETPAMKPFLYIALRKDLRMLFVEDLKNQGGTP